MLNNRCHFSSLMGHGHLLRTDWDAHEEIEVVARSLRATLGQRRKVVPSLTLAALYRYSLIIA